MLDTGPDYEVVIVGGGPAGLSAALVLGRCRRRVLLCDAGKPRNYAAREMHGYLGRDASDSADLRREGREQLKRYDTVELRDVLVRDAQPHERGFAVELETGQTVLGRKLLLASGTKDILPDVEGLQAIYGETAHNCPYCDGWEWRDRGFAVCGDARRGPPFALELLGWSRDVILFTNGATLGDEDRQKLARNAIAVHEGRLASFDHDKGKLTSVRLSDGMSVPRDVLFFTTPSEQSCALASGLGCKFDEMGLVTTEGYEHSGVPGLFVAGDASRNAGLAIVAAAEGARAAFGINSELLAEDLL